MPISTMMMKWSRLDHLHVLFGAGSHVFRDCGLSGDARRDNVVGLGIHPGDLVLYHLT